MADEEGKQRNGMARRNRRVEGMVRGREIMGKRCGREHVKQDRENKVIKRMYVSNKCFRSTHLIV